MSVALVALIAGVALHPTRHAVGHLVAACGLLATWTVLGVTRIADAWPFVWDAMPSKAYAGLITAICAATIVGLVRGAVWARWVGMAFAATVALGGTLNAFGMRAPHGELGCEVAIGVIGGLALWMQLATPAMRERFQRVQPLWQSTDRLVRSARWAAIAACIAAPMLVLYALCQPVVAATVIPAFVLAPVLALGAGLVAARRTAGVIVLAVAGLAMTAQLAITLAIAEPRARPTYYVALLGIGRGTTPASRVRSPSARARADRPMAATPPGGDRRAGDDRGGVASRDRSFVG